MGRFAGARSGSRKNRCCGEVQARRRAASPRQIMTRTRRSTTSGWRPADHQARGQICRLLPRMLPRAVHSCKKQSPGRTTGARAGPPRGLGVGIGRVPSAKTLEERNSANRPQQNDTPKLRSWRASLFRKRGTRFLGHVQFVLSDRPSSSYLTTQWAVRTASPGLGCRPGLCFLWGALTARDKSATPLS
jgi:hypothetical protein